MFLNERTIRGSWQSFERIVCRYLLYSGYRGIRLVGQRGDKGADIICNKYNKRWLIQAKRWNAKVGSETIDETLRAQKYYKATIPVIVSRNGFTESAMKQQQALLAQKYHFNYGQEAGFATMPENLMTITPLGSHVKT